MSKAARTTTTGVKIHPPPLPRHEDGRVSGARRALNYGGYDGLMQLGSDAFSAPLPPAASQPPLRFLPRLSIGWYMLSAAVGFSIGAVALAMAFKPTLSRQHPPVRVATAAYTGSWTMLAGNHPTAMHEVLEPTAAPIDAPALATPAPVQPQPEAAVAQPAAPATVAAAPASDPASEPSSSATSHATGSSTHKAHSHVVAPVAQLSRAQVISAMQQVTPAVANCFATAHGTAVADITIIGSTGRITTAQVSGQSGLVGSCIARVVRHAIFPTFKSESITIRYPFAH